MNGTAPSVLKIVRYLGESIVLEVAEVASGGTTIEVKVDEVRHGSGDNPQVALVVTVPREVRVGRGGERVRG